MGNLMTLWFRPNPATDAHIRSTYSTALDDIAASVDEFEDLKTTPKGCLTLIIALDQFPRNIYRNSAQSFAYDAQALALAKSVVDQKWDLTFNPIERLFVYLPFEHSENMSDQNTCVAKMEELLESVDPEGPYVEFCTQVVQYAKDHRALIEQFSRYPHRNSILGRESTPEEILFLQDKDELFGVSTAKK